MHHHHHDDDVEGVEEPDIDHLDVGSLGDHFIDGGLNSCNNHHGGNCYHDPILEIGYLEVESHVGDPEKEN